MRQKPRTFGKGRAWNKNGVHILHLQGSYREMASQHGALLKPEILQGALPYLGEKNISLIRHSPLVKHSRLLQEIAIAAIKALQKPMLAQLPRTYVEESTAISKATGLPAAMLLQSSLQADTLVLLMRYSMGRYLLQQARKSVGLPGCTSIVSLGEHTKSGSVLHARNMDYPAVGFWDPFPTVLYCDPSHGQRTICITSAGIHSTGVTSINESGLTLSTHFHCARRVSPFGTPIHIIGSEAMRKAKTIGQFIDIVSSFERAASWSMAISSAQENRAAVIEMVHGDLKVRDADETGGFLVNTNMFRNEELQQQEVLIAASAAQDFRERFDRAMDLMKTLTLDGSRLEAKHFARILGDHFDRELGQVRGQGNAISVITTVTSMISSFNENKFWIANRGEAPVSLGDYLELKCDENFKNFQDRELPVLDWFSESSQATTVRGTNKEEALSRFRDAYIAFHNYDNYREALQHLKKARTIDSEEGHYDIAAGHMQMRLGLVEDALDSFLTAKKKSIGSHMAQTVDLFIAHARDCLGERDKAKTIYQKLLSPDTVSPHVRAEAKVCLKKPYKLDRAHHMTFDLQFCDSFEYA